MKQTPPFATRIGLLAACMVPLLYFGAQLAAAPFFPGYSFLTHSASMLGSDRSTLPQVLNTGAFLTGAAALMAAFGMNIALKALGAQTILRWLVTLAVASMGVSAIWASLFHLPDPRHNPGVLGAGIFLVPFVFPAALWRLSGVRRIRLYLIGNLLVFAGLACIMSGLTGIDLAHFGGLLQRCLAAVTYVPVGVVGWFLFSRIRRSGEP